MLRLKPFQDQIPIPDVIRPEHTHPVGHSLMIAAQVERLRLHHDLKPADFWCYRQEHGQVVHLGQGTTYLGPTVEVQSGERVTVDWRNEIPATATLPFEVIKVPNPDVNTTLPVPENEPGATVPSPTRTTRRGRNSRAQGRTGDPPARRPRAGRLRRLAR